MTAPRAPIILSYDSHPQAPRDRSRPVFFWLSLISWAVPFVPFGRSDDSIFDEAMRRFDWMNIPGFGPLLLCVAIMAWKLCGLFPSPLNRVGRWLAHAAAIGGVMGTAVILVAIHFWASPYRIPWIAISPTVLVLIGLAMAIRMARHPTSRDAAAEVSLLTAYVAHGIFLLQIMWSGAWGLFWCFTVLLSTVIIFVADIVFLIIHFRRSRSLS